MISLPINLNATKIDLSGLGLKEIPKKVFQYKNLRKLSLKNNTIKIIPTDIKKLKLLNTLDISNNQLTTLYASLFELKKLEVLIVNNNKIKNLPSQIKKLEKLKILGIANNQLVDLNANFEYLKELRELNISGNKLYGFPLGQILMLHKLEKLWIKQEGLDVFGNDTLKKIFPNFKKVYHLKQGDPTNKKDHEHKIEVNVVAENKIITKEEKTTIVQEAEKIKKEDLLNTRKKKIFISYSHQNVDWLERVKKHIKVLSIYSDSDFEVWDDNRINSGDNWKEEIKNALSESTAAILLISTDFLASDFIKNEELQPLLDMAEKKGTRILPLILSPCRFLKINSLKKFQAVNDPIKEILSKLNDHDQEVILEKLTDDIEDHVNSPI